MKTKIKINREVFEQRLLSLNLPPEQTKKLPTSDALSQLEHQVSTIPPEKSDTLKPLKRTPKSSQQLLSLYQMKRHGSVTRTSQIKAARLGVGKFARTFLHIDDLPLQPGETHADHCYALKVFKIEKPAQNTYEQDVRHEITVLKKLGRLIAYEVRDCGGGVNKHNILEKYYPGETLKNTLSMPDPSNIFSDKEIRVEKLMLRPASGLALMRKICEAVHKFHSTVGYSHGDLNQSNIMITPEWEPVLIDFNFSRPFGEPYYYGYVTHEKNGVKYSVPGINHGEYGATVAPECCGQASITFTTATDVYALGYILEKILKAMHCSQLLQNSVKSYIRDMRLANPSERVDLPTVIQGLKAMEADPAHLHESRRLIGPAIKQQVLYALSEYETNIASYFAALVFTSREEKKTFISQLCFELSRVNIREEFLHTLKNGFKGYIAQFIVPELDHYIHETDLGRGLGCFIKAVMACGLDIDVHSLIREVEQELPGNSPSAKVFACKLTERLSPRSLPASSDKRGQRCA